MSHVGIEVSEERCTGCGACQAICPQSCIDLQLDRDGYWKRHVREDNCINCEKCLAVCSAKCELRPFRCDHSYVAYAKKRMTAYKSASGGIAHVLSKAGIEKGWTVVGAVWNFCVGGG